MSDPRQRRASQLRRFVLDVLEASGTGLSAYVLWYTLRDSFPGSVVTDAQLRHALATLKLQGRVRYQGRRWELVP